jgi:hypothetical protein
MSQISNDIFNILNLYCSNNPGFLIYIKKNNILKKKIKISCEELMDEKITIEFIELYYNQIKWNTLTIICQLDENILYRYYKKFNWNKVSLYQNLSTEFIINNYFRLNEKNLKLNVYFPKKYIKDLIFKKKGDKYMADLCASKKRLEYLRYMF